MKVIDTCSLLNIHRYYRPFDADNILYNALKDGVESGEFIIIDKVYQQCGWVLSGLLTNVFPFLKDNQTKTIDLIPEKHFFNLVENDFKSDLGHGLTPEQFEVQKKKFLADADANMILFCLSCKDKENPPKIVTDETGVNNDNKYFKKIPLLCDIVKVGTMSSIDFLKEATGFEIIIR